jgi:hypothetical protein
MKRVRREHAETQRYDTTGAKRTSDHDRPLQRAADAYNTEGGNATGRAVYELAEAVYFAGPVFWLLKRCKVG